MSEFVFDAEPLLAFLYDEPGHDAVAARLQAIDTGDSAGSIAEVTASELLYLIARIEGEDGAPTTESLRVADRDVRSLERYGLTLRRAEWRLAGEIKADGHISLGDAYAVALAHERDVPLVVGGDDDFDALPVSVDIERFRDGSV